MSHFKSYLFVLLMFFAGDVLANDIGVATIGGVVITLEDTPCAVKLVLDNTRAEYKPMLRHGKLIFEGEISQLCWLASPDGTVHFMDEDGDVASIPAHEFQKPASI